MSDIRDLTIPTRKFNPPLTIGVIADTHVLSRKGGKVLAPEVLDLFRRAQVDLLVHCGDICTRSVLEDLAEIAPVIAVVGNGDDEELQYTLKRTARFTVGTLTFGVVHGHGGTNAITVARRMASSCDCVLFGHSHKPLIEKAGGSTLFNPGSATDRRWFDHFGIGIIKVEDNRFDPELILYADPAHLVNIRFEKGTA